MPTVSVMKEDVEVKLGKMTDDEFNDLCFDFGLELDEITSEYDMVLKEQGPAKAENCSMDIIYKVDVPANRYDILCVEGLTRALSIFKSKMETPRYTLKPDKPLITLTCDEEVAKVRPYVVGAILRNVQFNKARYNSFIALQDKLHSTIGRRRTMVSIGTHDLDTIQPPFKYSGKKPSEINFVPLNEEREFRGDELMVHYGSSESHLKPYLSIIRDFPVYPIIEDSNGVVCSLPPIINSEHSKIHENTKNIFIEITATNKWKASVALDTLVTLFSEYCEDQFTIEPIEVIYPDNNREIYPELPYRNETVSIEYINRCLGTNLTSKQVAELLSLMGMGISLITETVLNIEVPPTRHDILHRCDLMEDVAIALGYSNIERRMDFRNTVGGKTQHDKLTYGLRLEMLRCGFTEALSFVLCSRDDISTRFGVPIESIPAVHIANPKTAEFQVVRTTLMPGILWTIQSNQHLPLPLSLFEVQDVVLRTDTHNSSINKDGTDVKNQEYTPARNERRLCAIRYGTTPDFELLIDVLYTIMSALDTEYVDSTKAVIGTSMGYSLETPEIDDPSMMKGRNFNVILYNKDGKQNIGKIGIFQQDVLKKFQIRKGLASCLEINVEPFL